MMEALSSSETLVLTRARRRNIPEDAILRTCILNCVFQFEHWHLWSRYICIYTKCSSAEESNVMWCAVMCSGLAFSPSFRPRRYLPHGPLPSVLMSCMISSYSHTHTHPHTHTLCLSSKIICRATKTLLLRPIAPRGRKSGGRCAHAQMLCH
jgi:hypothetical protein